MMNFIFNKKFRLATYTAVAVNTALIFLLGLFLAWDYFATTRTHINEKKIALNDEAQILLSAVSKIGSHHPKDELQKFINTTCSSMVDSTSPGHHIAIETPYGVMQAQSHNRASAKIFQTMKKAAADDKISDFGHKTILVGYAHNNNYSVYVSEYLVNVYKIGREEVIHRIYSILILELALIMIINIVLQKHIAKPLKKMVASLNDFGRGNMHTRMSQTTTHELDVFINEFNKMAQKIQKTDNERSRLVKKLNYQNKQLERFVYITSHDLRSPLVNIQGFGYELENSIDQLENSKDKPRLVAQMKESLEYIKTSAEKIDSLIEGLLKLSRAGRNPIKPEKIDMNSLVQNVLDSMKFQINETKTDITLDPLPPCYADPQQINQVFSNLLSNALKYLDQTRKGKIRISGSSEKNFSIYTIEDNGIGIPPEHIDKIFEIFHRVEHDEKIKGEGIGLSIVQKIIERHNGSIYLESKPQKGTTFYIKLPNS